LGNISDSDAQDFFTNCQGDSHRRGGEEEGVTFVTTAKSNLKSYFEIEINKGKISVLERAGHGQTKKIVNLLKKYGLNLKVNVDAPCG